jgi:penicillin G amidase
MSRLRSAAAGAMLVAGMAVAGNAAAQPKNSPTTQRIVVPTDIAVSGLRKSARIVVDDTGMVHIYAENDADLFFAQGYNAARERLFQIDLWRRKGLGLLSSAFGTEYLESDIAARAFLYRGPMDQEWSSYGPNAKPTAEAFVAGVNAYVRQVITDPDRLPEEFKRLDYQPLEWSADDLVRIRSHGLWRNVVGEVQRAQTLCKGGIAADKLRLHLEPPHEVAMPDRQEICSIAPEVLKSYTLATSPVTFTPKILRRAGREANQTMMVAEATPWDASADPSYSGSNNWVISGRRTATGRPILASDPHRNFTLPSLRYGVHLKSPSLNVIGAGEPFLPGVSIGHNANLAFGFTIFASDQEDLFFYEADPQQPGRYRTATGWQSISTVKEVIPVRDAVLPVEADIAFTSHGPILHTSPDGRKIYALRAAWLEPGMAPYFGSIGFMRSRTVAQFRRAMKHWGAPAENMAVADVHGNIAMISAGKTPNRSKHDGLLPTPGAGEADWSGYIGNEKLPYVINPKAGWLASANEMNLPQEGYPKVGYEWAPSWRFDRINRALSKNARGTLDDQIKLMSDEYSIIAEKVLAYLPQNNLEPSAILLRSWNRVLDRNSSAGALFSIWYTRHLGKAIAARVLGSPDQGNLVVDSRAMIDILGNWNARIGDGPDRDTVLNRSLDAAFEEAKKLLGSEVSTWRWGDLHMLTLAHSAAAVLGPGAVQSAIRAGGDGNTVSATRYTARSFAVTGGASFKMIIDVGRWDKSLWLNFPGQSGITAAASASAHAVRWGAQTFFPMHFSDTSVRRHTVSAIRLTPAP